MDAARYSFAELRRDVRADFRAAGGTTVAGALCTFLWDVAFQLLLTYRLARWLDGGRLRALVRALRWLQYSLSGSEISPRACVGRNVHFPHPSGIVIGAGVVVEDDAWIYQRVTIGSHGKAGADKLYPVVARGARIYAGAKVLGGIRVGAGAVVGANSVALRDVPDGATVVGLPARAVEP